MRKNNKFKKFAACAITVTMVAMSLAACQSDSDKSSDDTVKAAASDTVSESKGTGEGYGTKEETVYVTTAADGSVENIIVSDWLKNPEGFATLKDVTNLSDIVNVKGNETFNIKDGEISFASSGKDIYYQGKLDNKTTLPVSMKITYKIDGKEIPADKINGKSGKLTMTIEYTANEKTADGVFVPFLAMTGMLLPTENFTNIQVTNGHIVSNGDYSIVAGFGIPGISESLGIAIPNTVEITADVNNYTVDMMMTVCTNSIFSDIKADDLDKINDLSDMVSLLSDSSSKLTEGANALNQGLTELKNNAGTLSDGVSKLNNGAAALNSGLQDLGTGASSLDSGISALYTGAVQVNEGMKKLSAEMSSMITTIQQTISDNNNKITQLKAGITQLAAKLQSTTDAAIQAQIKKQIDEYTANANQLGGANAALQSILDKLTAKDSNGKTLADNLAALSGGTQNIVDGSSQLSDGSKQLTQGISQLSDGSQSLADGLNELNGKVPVLIDGINKLADGASQLNSGMSQFNESAIQKIADVYENDFSAAIDDIKAAINAGKAYTTLTGVNESSEGTSTFIIKTK